jgi:hypothetical protein
MNDSKNCAPLLTAASGRFVSRGSTVFPSATSMLGSTDMNGCLAVMFRLHIAAPLVKILNTRLGREVYLLASLRQQAISTGISQQRNYIEKVASNTQHLLNITCFVKARPYCADLHSPWSWRVQIPFEVICYVAQDNSVCIYGLLERLRIRFAVAGSSIWRKISSPLWWPLS